MKLRNKKTMNEEIVVNQEVMNAANEEIMNEGGMPREGMNDTPAEAGEAIEPTEIQCAEEIRKSAEIQGMAGREVEPVRERVTFGDVINGVKSAMDTIDMRPRSKFKCPPEYMEDLLLYGYMHYCRTRQVQFTDSEELRGNIRSIAKWMTDPMSKPSLLIHGGCGTGKSAMLAAIEHTVRAIKMMAQRGIWVFGEMPDYEAVQDMFAYLPIIGRVTATNLSYIAQSEPDKFYSLGDIDFLIVDDMGSEPKAVKRYGVDTSPLSELICRRYDTMQPMVITTNLSPQRIQIEYGQRIADRLRETSDILECSHESYRK